MRIGFVGIGLMGTPIVRHLMRAGHRLVVGGSNGAEIERLVAAGAEAGGNPRRIAAGVDVFFSCRVSPRHSLDTFLGADGVLASGRGDLLCIDLATIDPAVSRRIGTTLGEAGMTFIDAPISGGPDGAEAGTLSIIAGGTAEAIARAEPLFALFGKKTFHMGPVGAGVATKLCNNMITITTHALLAEAMVLGVKSGIDADRLYEVLRQSSAASRTLERALPAHFLKRDFEAAATISTIMKDLQCAIDSGERLGVPLRLPPVAQQWYGEAVALGHAAKDITAVILPMEEAAHVRVGREGSKAGAGAPVPQGSAKDGGATSSH
jgi:3-hydroxyisobutyrate dehydrogenase-like beta-hydroxyacid dehydrogenase